MLEIELGIPASSLHSFTIFSAQDSPWGYEWEHEYHFHKEGGKYYDITSCFLILLRISVPSYEQSTSKFTSDLAKGIEWEKVKTNQQISPDC